MTLKARTKQCVCGATIYEKPEEGNERWLARMYCKNECRKKENHLALPIDNMIKRYAFDLDSMDEIASDYGISRHALTRIFHDRGIETKKDPRARSLEHHRQGIIELYKIEGQIRKVMKYYPHGSRAIVKVLQDAGLVKVRIPKRIKKGIISEAMQNRDTQILSAWR